MRKFHDDKDYIQKIKNESGDKNSATVTQLFQRAIENGKNGYIQMALEQAELALALCPIANNSEDSILYILGFLTDIYIATDNYSKADEHYKHAISLINDKNSKHKHKALLFIGLEDKIKDGKEYSRFENVKKFNIGSDFMTFRQEISSKYGDYNQEQAILFFERAVEMAKKDLLYNAIADAKTAYTFEYFSSEYQIVYLVGFLADLHININAIKKAKEYWEVGMKILDPDDPDYESDKARFDQIKEIIDSESWKDGLDL